VSPSLRHATISGLFLAFGVPSHAQEQPPRAPATTERTAPPAAVAPGETPPGELPPGEIKVRAESYEQVEKGHIEARGFVDLRMAGMRIQADRADVFETTHADGTVSHRVVAEGNVVFLRGTERLAGDRMEMDDKGKGFLENAVGYVEPGVFVEGRRVIRIDDDTYRVEGGRFTSCSQPNPRWLFSASSATIDIDDKIVAHNAVFKVKSVPTFYSPIFYYPIDRSGRSTGFLFPHFGYSNYRGFTVGDGFFWAMGRSWDQTFYADYYSKIGNGYGHELRWAGASPSRGTLRTYIFDLTGEQKLDYDLDYNILQLLPGSVRGTVQVRQYSNLQFQQQFQDNFNLATTRTQRWSGSLDKDLRLATLSLRGDRTTTYFGTDQTRVNGHEPSLVLRRYPRQVGWGGIVFGLNAAEERLRYGNQDHVDLYNRFNVAPAVSRPLHLSFLDVNPQVSYHYTRYGTSYGVDEAGESGLFGPILDRNFVEAELGVTGPTFSRVFLTPGVGYSDRFKHTIGPEITWTYRTRVDSFDSIPKFDGEDYYLGTNQVAFALVQRFFAKRKRSPTAKAVPYEFFSWRLMQTYYVQISDGQSNFDPNYSSSAFGPGLKPEHLSPLLSRMKLRPSPAFSVDFQVEYDVNFKQVRRTSTYVTWSSPRVQLNTGWSRAVRLSENPEERIVGSESLRGSVGLELVRDHVFVNSSADYDIKNDTLWQLSGKLRYQVQCCGFSVEFIQYNWNGRDERQWRFTLQLANIGSIGSFMGGGLGGSQGFGSYR
jgi:LPS-assembly protein